jgi:hypothetical protein
MYSESEIYGLNIDNNLDAVISFEVGVFGGGNDYYAFSYCRSVKNWEICLQEPDSLNVKLLSIGDTLSKQKNWSGIKNTDYIFTTYTYYDLFPNSTKYNGWWGNVIDGYMGIRTCLKISHEI